MKRKKITRKTRRKLSASLRKYWRTWEGKHRKHEYFKIPPGGAKAFREKQKSFRSRTRGEYDTHLYERQKPYGGYKRVPLEAFRKGRTYLVYIYHRKTRRSRLLASGPQWELPVASLKWTQDKFPVITQSRRFNPLPMKKRGKWLPISRFYNKALKNIETQRDMMKENYKIRGSIMPLKRYYNPDLMIFSDEIVGRKKVLKTVFAHVVTSFDYPSIRWISARHIKVDFKRGIRVEDLKNKLDEIEDLAQQALRLEHRKADIHVLMVDGFIPTEYFTEAEYRKQNKGHKYPKTRKKATKPWDGSF